MVCAHRQQLQETWTEEYLPEAHICSPHVYSRAVPSTENEAISMLLLKVGEAADAVNTNMGGRPSNGNKTWSAQ